MADFEVEFRIVSWSGTSFNATLTFNDTGGGTPLAPWDFAYCVSGQFAWDIVDVFEPNTTFSEDADRCDEKGWRHTHEFNFFDGAQYEFEGVMPEAPSSVDQIPAPEDAILDGNESVDVLAYDTRDELPDLSRQALPVNSAPTTPKQVGVYYGDWTHYARRYFPWNLRQDRVSEKLTHAYYAFVFPGLHFPAFGDASQDLELPDGRTLSYFDVPRAREPTQNIAGVITEQMHGELVSGFNEDRWAQLWWWLPRLSDSQLTTDIGNATAMVVTPDDFAFWNKSFQGQSNPFYEDDDPEPPYGPDEDATDPNNPVGQPSTGGGGPTPQDAMGVYRHLFGIRDGVDHWNPDTSSYEQVAEPTNPDLRIMMSVGGWTGSELFSAICRDATRRDEFAQACVDQMDYWNFDGIDIDWEFPGNFRWNDGALADEANDWLNFTRLLSEIRTKLDALGDNPRTGEAYELSAFFPANVYMIRYLYDGTSSTDQTLSDNGLNPWYTYLDHINLGGYDFYGTWSELTDHQPPMFPSPSFPAQNTVQQTDLRRKYWNFYGCSRHMVEQLGVPAEKIVQGAPLYGRGTWGVESSETGGGLFGVPKHERKPSAELTERFPPGTFGWTSTLSRSEGGELGFYDFWQVWQQYQALRIYRSDKARQPFLQSATGDETDVVQADDTPATEAHGQDEFSQDFVRYFDDEAECCWLWHEEAGWHISYDDPETHAIKAAHAWARNLGGIFMFAADQDDGGADIDKIRKKRGDPPHKLIQSIHGCLKMGEVSGLQLWCTARLDDYVNSDGTTLTDRSQQGNDLSLAAGSVSLLRHEFNNEHAILLENGAYYEDQSANPLTIPTGAFTVAVAGMGEGVAVGGVQNEGFELTFTERNVVAIMNGEEVMVANKPVGPVYVRVSVAADGSAVMMVNHHIVARHPNVPDRSDGTLAFGARADGSSPLDVTLCDIVLANGDHVGTLDAEAIDWYLWAKYGWPTRGTRIVHPKDGDVGSIDDRRWVKQDRGTEQGFYVK